MVVACVPNFSEGRDINCIARILKPILNSSSIQFFHIVSGYSANRTVLSFAGNPEDVVDVCVELAKKIYYHIDMRYHEGSHPCFGSFDVCPLIPIRDISMTKVTWYARKLARAISENLGYPVYCYGNAAYKEKYRDLSFLRRGNYKNLHHKISKGFEA